MEQFINRIQRIISSSVEVKQKLLKDINLLQEIEKIVEEMIMAYVGEKKVFFCGNGGSAADAQHLAAELSGRYYMDRKSLFAEALHVNASYITAVANDYDFESIYSRYIEGAGQTGDVLIALSTSGNSENVVRAVKMANEVGMVTVGMTGSTGGKLKGACKYLLNVPSEETPRIQEAHILLGHIICELVEEGLFK